MKNVINSLFIRVSNKFPDINKDILLYDEIQNVFYSCKVLNYDSSLSGLVYLEIYLPERCTRTVTMTVSEFLSYYQWTSLSGISSLISTIY